MRLLVVGKLSGQLSTAVKMAMSAGAKVSHVETTEAATSALRAGQGADLMMVDYELDIAALAGPQRMGGRGDGLHMAHLGARAHRHLHGGG